jgi:hypothetical protein
MKRIYVLTKGPEDWKRFLAEPEKQWRAGFSTKALAHAWEDANGFPRAVKTVLDQAFPGVEPLMILPEHQVPLPGGRAASQSDVWILAKAGPELISIAVEGKVSEPFGPTVAEWNATPTPGRRKRLAFLKDVLGLPDVPAQIRYQLLHRTVSAMVEAERFTACHAAMLVHSFARNKASFEDFAAFVALFNRKASVNHIASVSRDNGPQLHLGWVADKG